MLISQKNRASGGAEPRKEAFAKNLRKLMAERNLTVVSLGKLMEKRLPNERFNSVNISHYRAGRSLPRAQVLQALSEALGVTSEELLQGVIDEAGGPGSQDPSLAIEAEREAGHPPSTLGESINALKDVPSFHVEDLPDGKAWLQINQQLSWSTVIKILQALKGEEPGRS